MAINCNITGLMRPIGERRVLKTYHQNALVNPSHRVTD